MVIFELLHIAIVSSAARFSVEFHLPKDLDCGADVLYSVQCPIDFRFGLESERVFAAGADGLQRRKRRVQGGVSFEIGHDAGKSLRFEQSDFNGIVGVEFFCCFSIFLIQAFQV
jgi:hypothetical protein